MLHIPAYCLDWHIGQSRAFYELLAEPLRPFVDIELTAWNGKDNTPLTHLKKTAFKEPVVFCQRPPTAEMLNASNAKLIWIPMWDNVALNWVSDNWWAGLPKNLRVIAFSEKVAQKAQKAGLPTLSLRYHKDPSKFEKADWEKGRILFYWNRTGLFGPQFIKKMCITLDIRELYFRSDVDPKIPAGAAYTLPAKIGRTIVHQVSRFDEQKTYFEILKHCNLYLAPRALEGVGLTFLEAMAGGCAVMAYNAPTMNEYIHHNRNGLIFANTSLAMEEPSLVQKAWNVFSSWISGGERKKFRNRISLDQDWDTFAEFDLETLGNAARVDQVIGFNAWKDRIVDYADFVLNW